MKQITKSSVENKTFSLIWYGINGQKANEQTIKVLHQIIQGQGQPPPPPVCSNTHTHTYFARATESAVPSKPPSLSYHLARRGFLADFAGAIPAKQGPGLAAVLDPWMKYVEGKHTKK